MLNSQAMDSLYSCTYMEDFLDCMENLPEEIQRNISRMRDLDIRYSEYMQEMESALEELLEEMDRDRGPRYPNGGPVDEEYAEDAENEDEFHARVRSRKRYVRARTSVQEILMKAQDIGDEKLGITQNIQDNVENKTRQLDLDKKNLGEYTKLRPREYGRENENQDFSKEEKEKPSIRRARRAKHEVYVPSIMGPSTLEVTSIVEPYMHDEKPGTSGSGRMQSYISEKPSSMSLLDSQERKSNATSHHQMEEPHGGRERQASKKDTRGSDPDGTSHTRASERTPSTPVSATTPSKQSQKANTVEKKGKKRKAKSSSTKSNKDLSPTTDTDAIDPDEPTYCLCDQISYGEMIGCDNDLCPIEWFHFSCVSLTHKPKGKWYCPRCRGDKPNVMKNRTVLIKELAKYNREREEKA